MKALVEKVAEEAGVTKTVAQKAFTAVIEGIQAELKAGGRVRIDGLGSFECVDRPAGMGRNPRTGEPVAIKASKRVKFKPGKKLIDSMG